MGTITSSDRHSIRSQAERFLETHGFFTPPLAPDQALAAQNLEVAQLSLDVLLVKANLPPEDHQDVQAMLDAQERSVAFKLGLHPSKKNWGSLHEVGHEFLPWQRELLYCCPLLWLPANVQKQLEAEADVFAAEAFFFGEQFNERAFEGDMGLSAGIELANNVYGTSLHSTFAHYVEESPLPQCLLVWKPRGENGRRRPSRELTLRYYVKSKSFRGHINPGQIADPDGVVARLFADSTMGITEHELIFADAAGRDLLAKAESFSNSYTVFTLISQPVHRSAQSLAGPESLGG